MVHEMSERANRLYEIEGFNRLANWAAASGTNTSTAFVKEVPTYGELALVSEMAASTTPVVVRCSISSEGGEPSFVRRSMHTVMADIPVISDSVENRVRTTRWEVPRGMTSFYVEFVEFEPKSETRFSLTAVSQSQMQN